MPAKSIHCAARHRVRTSLVALALLASATFASRATALIITGGPDYVLPGGGSCTVSGVASQTGGASISCTGVNLGAHTKVYFGMRVNNSPNGNTMTGVNPAAASVSVFRYASQTGSSITYTSTTTSTSSIPALGSQSVNNELVLTLTAGSASIVSTGGTPGSSANNGDIERLFQITSGSSFTVRADVKASNVNFGLGQACPAVYDPSHMTVGAGGDRSRVDVAFYYSDCGDEVVDSPEDCDLGAGNGDPDTCCTSTCAFRSGGEVCRPGVDLDCDTNETCTGSAAACPADDAVINGGNVCRPGSGDPICDQNELCTGVPGQACPPDDAPGQTSVVCRLGTTGDICDENELCTGVPGAICPADDAPGKLNVVCRAGSGDICDPDERCVGIPGMACPADIVANPSTVCRAGSGDMCDPNEFCTAIPTQPCPADVVQSAGTDCRTALNVCDVTEDCTGVALQPCPPNGFAAPSTPCNFDNNVCTIDECNGSGGCVFDSNQSCDDGNLCSQDSCDPIDGCEYSGTPSESCVPATKTLLKYKDNPSDPNKDSIKLLWRGGPFLVGDMGDPTTVSTSYELCIYDGPSGTFRMAMGVPGGVGWSTVGPVTSPKGYKYKDSFAAIDGTKGIKTKASSLDKAKLKWTGKGDGLPDTAALPFDFPVRAQVYASDGMCWEAEFQAGDEKKNDGGTFIGKR